MTTVGGFQKAVCNTFNGMPQKYDVKLNNLENISNMLKCRGNEKR